jgi:hypothetical protein
MIIHQRLRLIYLSLNGSGLLDTTLLTLRILLTWTHEREWRHPGDLEIKLKNTMVVLNSVGYQEFIEKCREIKSEDILGQIRGVVCLDALHV